METYGVDAVPFKHKDMDVWRDPFKGVTYLHKPTGFVISGGVDDVWVSPKGELIVADYKATSKDESPTLDAEWQDGYKRQMEIYQWLLRANGFTVSPTGYFVYANGRKDVAAFDAKLEFEVVLLPYTGSDDWVEKVLRDIKTCLDGGELPQGSNQCDFCLYREAAEEVTKKQKKESVEKKGQAKGLFG